MRWVGVLALCGCSQIFGLEAPVVRGDGGADVIDIAVDATDASTDGAPGYCFGVAPFTLCVASPPTVDLAITAVTNIDTSGSSQCDIITADGACVVVRRTITISAPVGTFGSRPLVFAADTIDIQSTGYIDASSSRALGPGPGGNSAACSKTGIDGASGTGTSGGAAGGSFGTVGGDGGNAANGSGRGLAAAAVPPPSVLRGGCAGGNGGDGGGGVATGSPGGGAVALLGHTSISIAGHIAASGGGGSGGKQASSGGGGGGSGGMIVLAAPAIMAVSSAQLYATGGGGGGGATQGANGGDGQDATGVGQALGGSPGNNNGGGGGKGAGSTGGATNAGNAAPASNGAGGGGGGGFGVIRVPGNQSLSPAQVIPAPT